MLFHNLLILLSTIFRHPYLEVCQPIRPCSQLGCLAGTCDKQLHSSLGTSVEKRRQVAKDAKANWEPKSVRTLIAHPS